jgi:molybdate transport system substrate-binding protein
MVKRLGAAALVVALGWADSARAAPAGNEVVVLAAASLKEVFEGLVPVYEAAHPGVKVRLALAGSQELRTQIEQGAPGDVFASADLAHMGALERQGLVRPPVTFARNEPVVVVPRANPAAIHSLTDLPRTRRLVIGAPSVPIGRYTVAIFEAAGRRHGAALRAGLEASVASRELNVRQVLAKVTLGEADAGIVYRTDALSAKDQVQAIAIPAELDQIAEYPIAALSSAVHPALARAWVALVLSPEGQRRLAAAGFLPPAAAARRPDPPPGAAVPAR